MGERIRCEITLPRIDHPLQKGAVQAKFHHRNRERLRNIMGRWGARIDLLQCIAPPLQPYLAQDGLSNRFANAGNLIVEGDERKESGPALYWGKEGCQIPVGVPGACASR